MGEGRGVFSPSIHLLGGATMERRWSTGLFDCWCSSSGDWRTTCLGCWCPCILYGKNVEALEGEEWSSSCCDFALVRWFSVRHACPDSPTKEVDSRGLQDRRERLLWQFVLRAVLLPEMLPLSRGEGAEEERTHAGESTSETLSASSYSVRRPERRHHARSYADRG